MATKDRRRQLNVRVNQPVMDAIAVAVLLGRLRGPQELLDPVLEDLNVRLRKDPLVAEMLRTLAKADATRRGRLLQLPKRARTDR